MAEIKTQHLTDAEKERLHKHYLIHREEGQSYIRTNPGNCVLPAAYEDYKEQIYNFKLRTDDVYVLTFPKNGTTWTLELVWRIGKATDDQTATDEGLPIMQVEPYIEFIIVTDYAKDKFPGNSGMDSVSKLATVPSPRLLKSHLPYCLLPPNLLDQCKVVACLRNPKDALVSYYHHDKLVKFWGFEGSFQEYFDMFMDDLVMYSSYWDYTVEAWKQKDHPNMCLLFFEDMKGDLEGSLRKVAKFIKKELTDGQVQELLDQLSFSKMRDSFEEKGGIVRQLCLVDPEDRERRFFRRGVVGDWKNYFTDEMNKRMDHAIEKHFGKIGLKFQYE